MSRQLLIIEMILIPLGISLIFGCRGVPFYRMTSKASASLVHSREGIIAFERGDLDKAEAQFKTALDLNEADLEVHRYYAETLWEQERQQEAIDVLTKASTRIGTLDNEIQLYESLGKKLLTMNRPSDALDCADKIIDLAPQKEAGWLIRANACSQLNRKDESLANYQKALHFSPDNREILFKIANIQMQMQLFDRALASWQHLERLYPAQMEPVDVLYGKAIAYRELNRLDDALDNISIAIDMTPDRIELYQIATEIALKKQDYKRAKALVSQCALHFPNDISTQQMIQKIDDLIQIAARDRSDQLRIQ
ncbi:MAG: tetratricopeptide repeat protein [Planctomycetia bacterium]|nr:tetratricopeptide repeat protein [Planctomycetia bacterium]